MQGQSSQQTKQNVFAEWRKYALERIERRKFKAVSSYFFICKVLKKTILALRMHAIQSRFTEANDDQNSPSLLFNAFESLKQHWKVQKSLKNATAIFRRNKGSKALRKWFEVSIQSQQIATVISHFERQRNHNMMRQFFNAVCHTGSVDAQ